MSYPLSIVVWNESKAQGNALLLLLALADMVNDRNPDNVRPSREYLAKRCRTSVRTIDSSIRKLEELDEISVAAHKGINGTNCYTVLLKAKSSVTGQGGTFEKPYKMPQARPSIQQLLQELHGDKQELHGAKDDSQVAPKSGLIKEEEGEGKECVEWPSLEDVLKAADEYPGNMSKGIPIKIPRNWAEYHYHHRTYEKQSWATNWKVAMVSLFEIHWQNGQPAAHGQVQQKQAGGFTGKKSGRPRDEILEALRVARENGESTTDLEKELNNS